MKSIKQSLLALMPLILLINNIDEVTASGGELRKRLLNYCDTTEYQVQVLGFDFIDNYESIIIFEFYSHVNAPAGYFSQGAPLSYFDDSVINDGNLFNFPRSYTSNDDRKATIRVTKRGEDTSTAGTVNVDTGEALYISCTDGEVRFYEDVTAIVLDDDFSYRINDASCSGGINVYGRSNRFYGTDFPLGGNIAVPEWDYPIRVEKADDPTQQLFINSHSNAGRHIWCLGSDFWQTADLTLSCINDCPRGTFDSNVEHDASHTIRPVVYENSGSPTHRLCLHSDEGDSRVKGVSCDRFASEQELNFSCDQDISGCTIFVSSAADGSEKAITLADDGDNIIWAERINKNPQQQWVVYRDSFSGNIAFESLQLPGKCLSYRTGSAQIVVLVDCEPDNLQLFEYTFVAELAEATPSLTEEDVTPNVEVFRMDGATYEEDYDFGVNINQFIAGSFFQQVNSIKYCSGRITIFDINDEIVFTDTDKNDLSTRECRYIFLTAEQKITVNRFNFESLSNAGSHLIDETIPLVLINSKDEIFTFQNAIQNWASLSDFNFVGPLEKVRFCGVQGAAFFILGGEEFHLQQTGCELLTDSLVQALGFGNLFGYRSVRRTL
eukprot:Awhi_evm1s8761